MILQAAITIQNPILFENALESLFQLMFVAGAGLYLIFAIVVIRQISIMKKTLITTFSPAIEVAGWVHFFLAIALLSFYLFVI